MHDRSTHPFVWLSPAAQRRAFVLLAVLAAGLMAALQRLGAPLVTAAAPGGIVSFELVGTTAGAQAILDSWDAAARVAAGLSLGLDYLFMPAYAGAIGLGVAQVARGLGPRATRLGTGLAWGQLLAALLDAVENVALIRLLLGASGGAWPAVARWCAIPKFALVALGLLYLLAGTGLTLWRRR